MQNVTTVQYKMLKFGGYDLARVMDPTTLEDQDDNIVNTEATAYVIGDGTIATSVKYKIVEDTTWTIDPKKLKQENISIYNYLLNPPSDRSLGAIVRVAGPLTTNITNVILIKGLDLKGSYNKFVNVIVKLQK